MRVAAISDIHGNLPALEAVLLEVEEDSPDLIVFCGDVASGPMPAETTAFLMTLPRARFVRGNADRGLVDEFDGVPPSPMPGPFADWCAKQIDRAQRDFLASFEAKVILDEVDGIGRVLFCHATPHNDVDVMTVETPFERVRELISGADADMVVCGHTHMQFDRTVDNLRIVNAGSAGMPYGRPGAYWAMLGPGLRLRRTDYDREAAARRIRAKDWANADEFAAKNVITVPTLGDAMTFLRKAEAKQVASGAAGA
ncbi:MAG TPA: metallophosphoesterase family protein [Candidatus Dormibacteraeota bacterium]|nr:metallophosphoesterase family protein [Candidatus Dormibacteraeota bacterium]